MPSTHVSNTTKTPTVARGALKLHEAAEYLGGLNTETVRRLVGRGLIKPNRATRILLFPVVELDRFLASEAAPAPAKKGENRR